MKPTPHCWRAVALLPLALAACDRESRRDDQALARPASQRLVITSGLAAGAPIAKPPVSNPLEVNERLVAEGKQLYGWFNCAGCHGGKGGGGIGPPLLDSDWIYGSDPENVYESIVQGRPDGMPSFARLSPDQVWRLVAYARSLDASIGSVSAEGGGGGAGGAAHAKESAH